MGENSKIEWCLHTFNAWEGCEKVSPGCANCYAERRDKQYHGGSHWGPNGTRKMMSEAYWKKPVKWNREAECNCGAAGSGGQECDFCAGGCVRPRVFCSSLADVFEDRPELLEPRRRLFDLINNTPNLDWLLLTKRPENVERLFDDVRRHFNWDEDMSVMNIWLGTSVENQEQADKRIPELLKIPVAVRFLSCEPLLGPVDLSAYIEYNPMYEVKDERRASISSSNTRVDGDRRERGNLETSRNAREQMEQSQDHAQSSETESGEGSRSVFPGSMDSGRKGHPLLSASARVVSFQGGDPVSLNDQSQERQKERQQAGQFRDGDAIGAAITCHQNFESRACMQPARRAELNGEIDEWPSGSNQGDLLGGRQDSGRDCSNVRGEIPSNLKDSERGSPEGTSGSYSRLLASPIIGEPEEKQQGAISWCIVGGESGPNARPMHPDWVRSLRDQCQAAAVPFHFKQYGEFSAPDDLNTGLLDQSGKVRGMEYVNLDGTHGGISLESDGYDYPSPENKKWCWDCDAGERSDVKPGAVFVQRIGKKAAGRTIDGRTWDEFPEA